jgi:hypothetical protein
VLDVLVVVGGVVVVVEDEVLVVDDVLVVGGGSVVDEVVLVVGGGSVLVDDVGGVVEDVVVVDVVVVVVELVVLLGGTVVVVVGTGQASPNGRGSQRNTNRSWSFGSPRAFARSITLPLPGLAPPFRVRTVKSTKAPHDDEASDGSGGSSLAASAPRVLARALACLRGVGLQPSTPGVLRQAPMRKVHAPFGVTRPSASQAGSQSMQRRTTLFPTGSRSSGSTPASPMRHSLVGDPRPSPTTSASPGSAPGPTRRAIATAANHVPRIVLILPRRGPRPAHPGRLMSSPLRDQHRGTNTERQSVFGW